MSPKRASAAELSPVFLTAAAMAVAAPLLYGLLQTVVRYRYPHLS